METKSIDINMNSVVQDRDKSNASRTKYFSASSIKYL